MRFSRTSSTTNWREEEVEISALSHDGRGLSRHCGKAVFVEGALEGEIVTIRPVKEHRKYINSRVRGIIKPSSERCQPVCDYFGRCGGCSLQYWSHKGQLEGKQRIVIDQLRRFADIEPETIASPLISSPYGYRYRCRLAIRWKKGQLQLGFREQQSQAICDIDHCPVLVESLQSLPGLLRDLLPCLANYQAISHAELFLADNGRGVLLRHIRDLPDGDQDKLLSFAQRHQLHLYLQDNNQDIQCLYAPDGDEMLYYGLPDQNLKLAFQPSDFTQVNWPLNRKMVAQSLEWLNIKKTDRVLDLFCGLGNFSLAIASKAAEVTGVEGSAGAVTRAGENALLNHLSNCEFFQADLSGSLVNKSWAQKHYDALVLDPPRTGAQEIIKELAATLPPRVLYISCNPATLARDAGLLKRAGFQLQRFGVMDMFPQTTHIESMALFTR